MDQFNRRMTMAKIIFQQRPEAFSFEFLSNYFGVTVRTIKKDVAAIQGYFNLNCEKEVCWFDRSN